MDSFFAEQEYPPVLSSLVYKATMPESAHLKSPISHPDHYFHSSYFRTGSLKLSTLHCSLSQYSSEGLHAIILTERDSNLTFTSPLITGLSSKPMTTELLSESKKSWITE